MIKVTRLNGCPIILNALLIESVESRPDTIITLTTGNKMIVKESVEEVIAKAKEYHTQVNSAALERLSHIDEETS